MFPIRKTLILIGIAFPLAAAMAIGIHLYQNLPLRTASYYLNTGDLEAALASVDGYLKTYPSDPYGQSIKAQIQSHRKQHHQAIQIYQEIGAEEKADYKCFLRSLYATRHWDVIPKIAGLYHNQFPDDPEVHLWTTTSYMNLGHWNNALASSQVLTRLSDSKHQGWAMKGDCFAALGKLNRASSCWEKSININPSATGLHRTPDQFVKRYAQALLVLKKPLAAIELLQEKSNVPLTSELHFILGQAYLANGKLELAKQQWRIANRSSLHTESLVSLAHLLILEKRYSEAVEVVHSMRHSGTVNIELAQLLREFNTALGEKQKSSYWAGLARKLKRIEQIEVQMQHFILHDPVSKTASLFNTYFLCKTGNWEQAQIAFQDAGDQNQRSNVGLALKNCLSEKQVNSDVLDRIQKQFEFSLDSYEQPFK